MPNITAIMKERKYTLSLPVPRLYKSLLRREVPVIPKVTGDCDLIQKLYNLLDQINIENLDWDFNELIILRFITRLKFSTGEYKDPSAITSGFHAAVEKLLYI